MVNDNKPNNNKSQFFVTLDQCPWLDRKHTIFGKVVGDTLYNLMAIGEEDTDASERPINPPRINRVEIVLNPFDDIFPRDLPKKGGEKKAPSVPKAKKPVKYLLDLSACSNMNLLSFADAEDFESEEAKKKKIISSHDALNDPSLSKEYAVSPEVLAKERERLKEIEERKEKLKQEISNKKKTSEIMPPPVTQEKQGDETQEAYAKFDEKMKAMLLKKRRLMDDIKKVDEEEIDNVDGEGPVVKGDAAGIKND